MQQFEQSLQKDINALSNYEAALQSGAVSSQQLTSIMSGTSTSAQIYTEKIKAGTGSTALFAEQQRALATNIQTTSIVSKAAAIGVNALKVALNGLLVGSVVFALTKLAEIIYNKVNDSIHKFKNYVEAATKAVEEFNSAISDLDSKEDTINNLKDEFNDLSKGIDENGRNVNLTGKQYENFQEILKKIAEINPSIVRGYDSENNMLIDKNTLLKETIELLQQEREEIIKNQSLFPSVKTAINGAIGQYKQKINEIRIYESSELQSLATKVVEKTRYSGNPIYNYEDVFSNLLGLPKFDEYRTTIDYYKDNVDILLENFDEIKQHLINEYGASSSEILALEGRFNQINSVIEKANYFAKTANSQLLYIPMAQEGYKELTDYQKDFISNYINTLKFTEELTDSEIERIRLSIVSMTQDLIDNGKNVDYFKAIFGISDKQKVNDVINSFDKNVEYAVESVRSTLSSYSDVIEDSNIRNALTPNIDLDKLKRQKNSLVNILLEANKELDENALNYHLGELTISELDTMSKNSELFAKNYIEYIDSMDKSTLDYSNTIKYVSNQTMDYLKNAGKLTSTTPLSDWLSSQFDDDDTYKDKINDWISDTEKLKTYLDKLKSGDEAITADELIVEFPDLAPYISKTTELSNAISMYLNDSLVKLKKEFGDTTEIENFSNVIDYLNEVLNKTLGGTTIEYINKLDYSYKELINLLSKVTSKQKLSAEEISRLISKYPDLTSKIKKTANGYTFEEDAIKDLINSYIDLENEAISSQLEVSKAAMEGLETRLKLFKLEAEQIRLIYDIYKNMGSDAAKSALSNELPNGNPKLDYISNIRNSFNPNNNLLPTNQALDSIVKWGKYYDEVDELLSKLEESLNRDKFSDSGSEKSSEEFDWIQVAIQRLEEEIAKLDKIASSEYYSMEERLEAYRKKIELTTKEIELQERALAKYQELANAVSIPEEYKQLVRDGAIRVDQISDDKLKEGIQQYQSYYESILKCMDAIETANDNIAADNVSQYDLVTSNLEEQLDSGAISQKEYLNKLKKAYEDYYSHNEKLAQKYHKAVISWLQKEKSYLLEVANAAASLFDDKISALEEEQENVIAGYNSQIKALEKQKKVYQDQLDEINKVAERENRILQLQKAQYELARAENQRSKLVYTDKGFQYQTDASAIKDARESVKEAELEIKKAEIQDIIDSFDDEIERINEIIDSTNEYYETRIKNLQKLQDEWKKVTDDINKANYELLINQEFGSGAVERILNGDTSLITEWKQKYVNALIESDIETNGRVSSMTQAITEMFGIESTPLQEQLMMVINLIDSDEDISLTSSTEEAGRIGTEVISAQIELMDGYTLAIQGAITAIDTLAAKLASLPQIKLTSSVSAFASGTKGLKKNEPNALTSEYSQPELIVKPNGETELTTEPTIQSLPKGTIIYDENQTKKILKGNNSSLKGHAFANGTSTYLPLNVDLNNWYKKIGDLISIEDNMYMVMKNINRTLINSDQNTIKSEYAASPNITFGDINVNCTGTTSQEVISTVASTLEKSFQGMALRAYQQSMK